MPAHFRNYNDARLMFSVVEMIGWTVVVIGGVSALIGFVFAGNILGPLFIHSPMIAKLLVMLPGLGLAFSGLVSVALVRVWGAQIDTAESTQEILKIAVANRDKAD